jgi:hypothetical protein
MLLFTLQFHRDDCPRPTDRIEMTDLYAALSIRSKGDFAA